MFSYVLSKMNVSSLTWERLKHSMTNSQATQAFNVASSDQYLYIRASVVLVQVKVYLGLYHTTVQLVPLFMTQAH